MKIECQCARCKAPMSLDGEYDPEILPLLLRLILCPLCAPKPDSVKPTHHRPEPVTRRDPYRDD